MPVTFVEQSPDLPLVHVYVALRSGAVTDPPGKEGLSRVVVRMLRRGAGGLGPAAIEERIDELGGELSADVTRAVTSIYGKVIRRSLDPFLDLLADLLAAPAFDEVQLERLRRLAAAEVTAARDNDGGLASRAFRRVLFDGHLYARSIQGTTSSVRELTRDDVRTHYERHYTRANAIVAIAGPVEADEAAEIAERVTARLPEGEAIADPTPPPMMRQGRRLVVVDKPGRTQTQLVVGALGPEVCSGDYLPFSVANVALGGTFQSRLVQAMRVANGYSYFATSHLAIGRQREAFTMRTAPSSDDSAPCLAAELELLRAFCDEGMRDDELEFVKKYLVRSFAFEVDTAKKRLVHKLEAELLGMPQGNPKVYLEKLAAMELERANQTIAEYVSPQNLVIAAVGDYHAIGPRLMRSIPGLAETQVLPYDFE